MPTREDAQAVYARMLMERIRQDPFPSATHMALLEQVVPDELVGDYIEVLLEKVVRDPAPSIPMLHRINRVIERMPA